VKDPWGLAERLDQALGAITRLEKAMERQRGGNAHQLLTADQAASIAGCSTAALRKRIARGQLRVIRHGRAIRVRLGDLTGDDR